MYQYRSGLLPYSFNNMFLVTRQVHSYGTRSSEHFYLPQCRTNIRKFSISFQGPKFFNSLLTVQERNKFYIELIVLYVHPKIAIMLDHSRLGLENKFFPNKIKKAKKKKQLGTCSTLFLYSHFFAVVLHDDNVKLPETS